MEDKQLELKNETHLPGPRRSVLMSIITMIRIGLGPYTAMRDLRQRYGDPFHMWIVGMGDVVGTGRPELIKSIYALQPTKFSLMNTPMLEFFFGPRSLFTSEGETHQRDKKLVFPHFRGERMRAYGDTMAQCAIDQCSQHLDGKKVSLMELSRNITLEVMMRTQLGLTDEKKIAEIKELLYHLNNCQNPLLGYKFFRNEWGGFGPWAKFQRYNRPLRAYLIELIREARARDEKGEDILSLLCETKYEDVTPLEEEHISDHIFSILIAGYDTTANSITWSLDVFHRHPEALEKIQAEIDSVDADAKPDDLTKLPWLDSACYEILRLYPPIESLPVRQLEEDYQLDDYVIPKGYGLCPIPALAHRDPELYPEPDRFNPERFISKKPDRFAFLPFGGGARLCIGFAFANYQMRVVLGTCLKLFKFELLDPPPKPKRYSITIGPKENTNAIITKR